MTPRPPRRHSVGAALLALLAGLGGVATLPSTADAQQTEGITVHGDWTIEVYDGDRLVERRTFSNDLTASGSDLLIDALVNGITIGGIGIRIDADWAPTDCPGYEVPAEGQCYPDASVDTTATVPTTGPDAGKLVIESSVTNDAGTLAINGVATELFTCAPSVLPADCTQPFPASTILTATTLDTPVDAAQDQTVQITVVLSFN